MITDPSKLIIRRPGAQTAEGKIISWLLSLGIWWRLAHLIRVFLAAVGWGAAWGLSSSIAGRMQAVAVLHAAVIIYVPEVLGLILLLWGWAFYNWRRFHGERNKRCEPLLPLSLEEAGNAFSLPLPLLRQAREAKISIYSFDDRGNICGIDCCVDANEGGKSPAIRTAAPAAQPDGETTRCHARESRPGVQGQGGPGCPVR